MSPPVTDITCTNNSSAEYATIIHNLAEANPLSVGVGSCCCCCSSSAAVYVVQKDE